TQTVRTGSGSNPRVFIRSVGHPVGSPSLVIGDWYFIYNSNDLQQDTLNDLSYFQSIYKAPEHPEGGTNTESASIASPDALVSGTGSAIITSDGAHEITGNHSTMIS